jgi:hypothetical protein
MPFDYNEVVRSGNTTARVKNFTDSIVILVDIIGELKAGDTIVGDDSGFSYTINSISSDASFDNEYTVTIWDDLSPVAVTQDDGAWVVQDAHFTGKESQDYQPDNVVTIDT